MSFIADPTPARPDGTADISTVVSGALVAATPIAIGMMAIHTMSGWLEAPSFERASRPRATKPSPTGTTRATPYRALTRGTRGATTSMTPDMGSTSSPASRADRPSTSWRNCEERKNVPNMAKNVRAMPPEATLNRRSRNRRRSSIGSLAVVSRQANSPRTTAAPANAASVTGSAHPWAGASMMA